MSTAAQRRALEQYLATCRNLLRLQAWDVTVSARPPDNPDVVLTITPHEARHTGTVRIGNFFELNRTEQRYAAVHELVHLVQAALWEWAEEGPWPDRLPADLRKELEVRVHHDLEVQADFLARAMATLVPLPPAFPK